MDSGGYVKHIVSVSFGKDSLAMLLRMIEEDMQIDEVIYFDTGMEFSCIYNLRNQISKLLEEKDIQFTVLTAKNEFLFQMFDRVVNHRDGTQSNGYRWCGGTCRWYTAEKTRTITRYLKHKYGKDNFIEYVGIALDEPGRADRAIANGKKVPLVDWQMTERDCLDYCREHGYSWLEDGKDLYEDLDRVSCWLCRNKNLKELKNIYLHHKQYWFALCEIERRCGENMKRKSLLELEEQWKQERESNG